MALTTRDDLRVPREDQSVDGMMALINHASAAIGASEAKTLDGLRQDLEVVFTDAKYKELQCGVEYLKVRLFTSVAGRQTAGEMKRAMSRACHTALTSCSRANDTIVNYVLPFIRDTSVVIVHGCGVALAHCVASSIALRTGVRFLVAEGLPDGSGQKLVDRVRQSQCVAGLEQRQGGVAFETLFHRSVAIIPDSCVASLLPEADFVLVGANAVTEHGGLAHSSGTLQIAIIADTMRVPFYVLCESFKCSSIFPLSTHELYTELAPGRRGLRSALSASTLVDPVESPPRSEVSSPAVAGKQGFVNVASIHSSLDVSEAAAARAPVALYPVELVPPRLITFIFSEEGIMPPSAVADQMLMSRRALSTS